MEGPTTAQKSCIRRRESLEIYRLCLMNSVKRSSRIVETFLLLFAFTMSPQAVDTGAAALFVKVGLARDIETKHNKSSAEKTDGYFMLA